MEIRQIKELIPVAVRNRIPLFFWGKQGVGKSQLLEQLCKELGIGFVRLNLAAQEVGDIIGLLDKRDDGKVHHLMPKWFPTEGKGIIYMDEFNRAHPDVIQAIFPLLTEFQFHTHVLPEGWVPMAAGNYDSNEYTVTDTSDAALISRFCHVDFNPTKEEFLSYIESFNDDAADGIADFIRAHPEMLEKDNKKHDVFEKVTPDRRSYLKYIVPLEKETAIDQFRYEVYSGIVGKSAASALVSFKLKNERRVSGRDIVRRYSVVRNEVLATFKPNIDSKKTEVRLDILNASVGEVILYFEQNELTEKQLANVQEFLLDLPMEMCLKFINELRKTKTDQKNAILNDVDFVKRFSEVKKVTK